ncbi:MAG: hypothetical protein L6R41_003925 [Letrouitia leprolyta]|nr:MAG: hypothetical protein L6R41_003925 [Letrouitia leprolyta]
MKFAILIAAAVGVGVTVAAPVADEQSGLDCREDGFCDAAPQEFPASVCCSGHALNNCCVSATEAYNAVVTKLMSRGEQHNLTAGCMPDGFFDAAPQEFPPSACCSGHVYHNQCVPARNFNVLKARGDSTVHCNPNFQCAIEKRSPDAALKALAERENPCVAANNCGVVGGGNHPSSSKTPKPTTSSDSVTQSTAGPPPLLNTNTPPDLLPPNDKRAKEFTTHLPIPASLLHPSSPATTPHTVTHYMPIPVGALSNHQTPPSSEATTTSVKHVGPGWSHTLHHEPLPTPLLPPRAAEGTGVHHVGPGWEHSVAHEPLPTTLVPVVVEEE